MKPHLQEIVVRTPQTVKEHFSSKAHSCEYLAWKLYECGIVGSFVCCPEHLNKIQYVVQLPFDTIHYTWLTKSHDDFVEVVTVLTRVMQHVSGFNTFDPLLLSEYPNCSQEVANWDTSSFFGNLQRIKGFEELGPKPSWFATYNLSIGRKHV